MTLTEVILFCANDVEFISEFNRLTGSKLGLDDRPAIIKMVDEAAGYNPFASDYIKFIQFVYRAIWLPLQDKEEEATG